MKLPRGIMRLASALFLFAFIYINEAQVTEKATPAASTTTLTSQPPQPGQTPTTTMPSIIPGATAATTTTTTTTTSSQTPSTGTTVPTYDANLSVLDYLDHIDVDFVTGDSEVARHHTHEQMEAYLRSLAEKYPNVTRLHSIGKSVQGRDLWVLTIGEQPDVHRPMVPEFRYMANIHGNEVVGREMSLQLARLLLENYDNLKNEPPNDTKPSGAKFARKLLQETRIHLLPSMNPDSYSASWPACKYEDGSKLGRLNANNVDLNRNFPDPIIGNQADEATQPEVLAFMGWSKSEPFVLSAGLHGGALVVSYPYDGALNRSVEREARLTGDDDVFQFVSKVYAQTHPNMASGLICYDKCTDYHKEIFPEGITNGAAWYSLYGGLQDWLYENTNEFDVTIEMGCNQYPNAVDLSQYWDYNKRPLIQFMLQSHRGIKGMISDEQTNQPLADVTVHVVGRGHNVTSSKFGDYFRLLVPGDYRIHFDKPGYQTKEILVRVDKTLAQKHNIKLAPLDALPPQTNNPAHLVDSTSNGTPPDTGEVLPTTPEVVVPGNKDEKDDHSIVVATLVMTTISVLILVLMAGAYIIQRRRLTRSQSMSVELQPARSGSTAFGATGGQSSGSSTNPHLAA